MCINNTHPILISLLLETPMHALCACLPACLYICLWVCASVSVSMCLPVSVCPCMYMHVSDSVCVHVCICVMLYFLFDIACQNTAKNRSGVYPVISYKSTSAVLRRCRSSGVDSKKWEHWKYNADSFCTVQNLQQHRLIFTAQWNRKKKKIHTVLSHFYVFDFCCHCCHTASTPHIWNHIFSHPSMNTDTVH